MPEVPRMQPVEAILFEPVGCLAEFPPHPFLEISSRLFGGRIGKTRSGSRAYWHLLNLMESSPAPGNIESLELQAVEAASIYEDVIPALSELKAMGVKLFLTSSLSKPAIARFLELASLGTLFLEVWSRDESGGVKTAPLRAALHSLRPERTMFLADTAEALKAAKSVEVNAVLMMNDPDEAKRLALQDPAGGIVSLHELPDFVRFVARK